MQALTLSQPSFYHIMHADFTGDVVIEGSIMQQEDRTKEKKMVDEFVETFGVHMNLW